ncbi:MAG TPA: hypothetical protein PK090_09005 [Smithellaceae bacterium]|nr:hypothetical protein [Smithellaceae bacterium]
MKKTLTLCMCVLILSCAGGQPAPDWKMRGYRHLEEYKQSFLSGKEDAAEPHFEKARRAFAAGNDLEWLSLAFLTQFALHTACLERFDTAPFARLYRLAPTASHMAYCHFLKGNLSAVDPALLDNRYADFLKAAQAADAPRAVLALQNIDDPLSRLIAAGVWIRYLPGNEAISQMAIDTAAANGWRRPLWAHLSALSVHYESQGETEKGRLVKERLELIKQQYNKAGRREAAGAD